jgi:C-terminal processing protease CtpA/Prc
MLFIILLFPLLFLACGEAELKIHDEVYEQKQEFSHNYWLLRAYFYHPERIKEYEEYKGMEIDTMYESLKDYFCGANHKGYCYSRYTYYLPPKKSDDKISDIENTKKYHSFGFERGRVINDGKPVDTLIVSAVYPISPAFDAGLKKRDKLLSANGISLTGENVAAYLKNDDQFENTTVFTVLRNGERKTLLQMQKKDVPKPTVYLDSLGDIPFIRVTEYKVSTNNPKGTYYEFKEILQEIKGAKTAIMDLRGNGGGNIWHCTAMAAELVPLDKELIYDVQHLYDDKRGNVVDTSHVFAKNYLKQEGAGINIKWIILMDNGSASCAERFIAAVKSGRRPETTQLIGQTSYGKGIGQIYTKTYLGGLAYITSLQTFYPDGTTFHNVGIKPNIQAESKDIYDKAIGAAQSFSLAKSSSTPIRPETLPPERLAENMEPGAHRRIEMPLFHQWE